MKAEAITLVPMPSLSAIAAWLGLEGDYPDSGEILSVASLEKARPVDAVFSSDAVSLEKAVASAAGCILARVTDAQLVDDPRVLPVKDPRYAFAVLAQRLTPPAPAGVHATALLGSGVTLGHGVAIGAGCVIGNDVMIGDNTVLDARVTVYAGVVIGARCLVQSGAVLGGMGFGYARSSNGTYVRFPQQGQLVIEDDVEIGANTTIDRGALEETRIGQGSKLDNLVHIGHNCVIGKNVVIAAQTGISGSSVVEDGAILGGQVGIGEHATVGDHVILGGGAGVLSSKKLRGPGEVFWGRPAQPLKQYLKDLAKLRKL